MNELETFLQPYSSDVRDLTIRLRDLIRSKIPDASEGFDWPAHLISYAYGKKYADVICTVMPHKSHVNLGFYRAVDRPDEHGLLEGTGKLHRHVKIRQASDIDNPALAELLEAAVRAKKKIGAG